MADGSTVTAALSEILNIAGNLTGNNSTSTAVQLANVINWLTFFVGLPALGLALYTLKHLSEGENKVPMHIVFLLVSDVVSFFGRPAVDQSAEADKVFSTDGTDILFYFGVTSNITLMLFIAQERHLLVAYPQCLGCCTSIKQSVAVTLLVWAAPFGSLALAVLGYNLWFAISLLAPFPFLLFLPWIPGGPSTAPDPTLQTQTGGGQFGDRAIWANYTVLYGPFILTVLLEALSFKEQVRYLGLVSHLLLYLSPLVDPFIYIFMTKGPKEVLQALPCCQKLRRKENMRPTVETVAETVETRL